MLEFSMDLELEPIFVIEATHKEGLFLRAYAKKDEGPKRWGKIEEADRFTSEDNAHRMAARKGLEPTAYKVREYARRKQAR